MIHFPILYVEDDHRIREKMQTILNRRFSNIHIAENGLIGLDLYHKISPRVMIVDLRMPQMGGLELIQKVREIDPNVHIIVTSAHSDKEDLLSAINLNVNRYLIKPINVNELLTHLNEEYDRYTKKNANIIPLSHCHNYDLNNKNLLKNNRSLQLTKTENDILHLLVTNPNVPMDYTRLETEIWGNIPMTKYALRTHVMQLRKKLGNEITIKNFSGQGYMLILNS
ncbi:MAG: response regulator transcription factor [Sulfuricurvum sp.]|nr:response regulator transcription factor [Sulfuricurvum sp.]MDP3021894.1 response regulator transcription factor [Sulfuricurvum sp.]MDP3120270.1 response regulator transcription factor [Sulfuricurvum sp.]